MKTKILFPLFVFNLSSIIYGSIKPVKLRCEYLEDPMPVDVLRPGKIIESGKNLDSSADILVKGSGDGYTIVEISSGRYHFESCLTR